MGHERLGTRGRPAVGGICSHVAGDIRLGPVGSRLTVGAANHGPLAVLVPLNHTALEKLDLPIVEAK